ncbi:MAG TPA: four helix bundle protein [Bacteroidota bacterium]|nr:four helix bundle protein [Bacteroidota bacterium]
MPTYEHLKERTKRFAIAVIRVVQSMSRNWIFEILAKQLVRSATSVGANYRGACRARSKADFISKISIVEEESDEVQYWLELLEALGGLPQEKVLPLHQEAQELTAIFTASRKTAKSRK